QLHAHPRRNVVRHQRRNSDAEIHVKTVLQLLGGARRHLLASPSHCIRLLQTVLRLRCSYFFAHDIVQNRGPLFRIMRLYTSTPAPASESAFWRLRTVRCSMCLTALGTCTMRCTYIPGVTM